MTDPPQFDHQKAQALIDKLNDAIRLLQSQTGDRSTKAQTMRKSWKGGYADQFFNREMPAMRNQAAGLVAQMQALVTQVGGAADAASQASAQWQRSQPRPSPSPQAPPPAPTPGR